MRVANSFESFNIPPELPGSCFSELCCSFNEVFPVCVMVKMQAIYYVSPENGEVKPYLVIVLFLFKPTTVAYEESLCFYGWFKCIDGCVCCLRNCCVSCVEYAIE